LVSVGQIDGLWKLFTRRTSLFWLPLYRLGEVLLAEISFTILIVSRVSFIQRLEENPDEAGSFMTNVAASSYAFPSTLPPENLVDLFSAERLESLLSALALIETLSLGSSTFLDRFPRREISVLTDYLLRVPIFSPAFSDSSRRAGSKRWWFSFPLPRMD